jgi:hypothetical protein
MQCSLTTTLSYPLLHILLSSSLVSRWLLYRLWIVYNYRHKLTTSSWQRGYLTLSPSGVSRYFLTGLFDYRPGRVIPRHPASSRLGLVLTQFFTSTFFCDASLTSSRCVVRTGANLPSCVRYNIPAHLTLSNFVFNLLLNIQSRGILLPISMISELRT